jgi:hypothetical protein
MSEKVDVPWHTGLLEGVAFGTITSFGVAVAGLAVAFVVYPVGSFMMVAGSGLAGTANMIKTIAEKREEKAQTQVESASVEMDGRMQAAGQNIARGGVVNTSNL